MSKILFASCLFILPVFVLAHGGELVATPAVVKQGEPFLVTVEGVNYSELKQLTFNGKPVPFFSYEGKPAALIGVDLTGKTGKRMLAFEAIDGDKGKKTVTVQKRPALSAPLGIPQKLGGNSKRAQKSLVVQLNRENAALNAIRASDDALWTEPFSFPLALSAVTDVYGYSRKTGSYSIPHKGTDFRAHIGTPVFSINRGKVALVRNFTIYGNTVIVDHGSGVLSLYMHLSETRVVAGQQVERGQEVGLSGESGYALEPHLHLSVRLSGVSIDPVRFFALFGKQLPKAANPPS